MKRDRKEYQKEYQKKYREANKERLAAYSKEYHKIRYQANKEKLIAQMKVNQESKKDGYYTVYYLKEEHYAGMTNNLTYRLNNHKSHHNRHIEDVEIIGKYETKEEATRVEAALHSMGHLGRHPIHKQQTLKQLL
jgi:predicted GIY-YIG superfamily endonuclease